jgi:hypothetical protein
MKLKDIRRSPVGGFYFDDPVSGRIIATDGNFDKLYRSVCSVYQAMGYDIPDNLALVIEDQICMRQPSDRCYYTSGLGDRLSLVIHKAAAKVDKLLGTQLEQKARGCGGCGSRRMKLNTQLSR